MQSEQKEKKARDRICSVSDRDLIEKVANGCESNCHLFISSKTISWNRKSYDHQNIFLHSNYFL